MRLPHPGSLLPFLLMMSFLLMLSFLRAEQGMYPISEIQQLDLPSQGLEIAARDVYDPRHVSLIDGICKVNGCTGSFVSPNGLIVTNHHCAYRAIQSASTTESNFLLDGFTAPSLDQEIQAKGYTVRITESYVDVSNRVLQAVNEKMGFAERTKAIDRRQKELEQEAEASQPGVRAEVAEMFQGKTYVLFHYTYIQDVRLVFAPPAAIGNFGGEVDNWEWPRHTGDFAFLRAYVAADGSTASYAPENVPYQPKRFIQVAVEGPDEGDFVFLLGYPGRTARHKTSSFLRYEQDVRLPFLVDLYGWQMDTMETLGKEDPGVALKHSSRLKSLANTEKRSRGQLKGLQRTPILARRIAEEARLQEFIQSDPDRQARYGNTLQDLVRVYAEMTAAAELEQHLLHLRDASRALAISFALYDAASERQKEDLDREPTYMDRNFDQTTKQLVLAVKDFHPPTDQIMLREMLTRLARVPSAKTIPPIARLTRDLDGLPSLLSGLYDSTRLGDESFVRECLNKSPDELVETKEPFLGVIRQLYPHYLALREKDKEREGRLSRLYGDLLEVKQAFLQAEFIPDANATLRLTYGHIRGYSPEDAVVKTPITTLRGVIDKTTGVDPFVTPQVVLDMHTAKDFGPFAHPRLDDVPVGLLYSTDTTGGNSGSPILNARGELVGVNFDRAFEATINDFAWDESYSRSIGVDMRYVLWITGKVYGVTRLLTEMNVPH